MRSLLLDFMGSKGGKLRERKKSIIIVVVLLLIALMILAVILGRTPEDEGSAQPEEPQVQTVRVVTGSEKMPYFEDPKVVDRFEELGLKIEPTSSGSREIVGRPDLDTFDAAFPSSSPAAEKVARSNDTVGSFNPFYSPMAIATFEPILKGLQIQGIASQRDGAWYVDMESFLALSRNGTTWAEVVPEYHSPAEVQISSTDIRSSNSAAMYMAVAAWVANGRQIPVSAEEIDSIVDRVAPLFTRQGYTDRSSSGPFKDYLSQGMGVRPMVMIYEAQFIGQQMVEPEKIKPDMRLAYLEPTISSQHTVVAFSDNGAKMGKLITEDPQLQALAAQHGFRTVEQGVLPKEMEAKKLPAPPELLATINPPDYERMEQLIEAISAKFEEQPPAASSNELEDLIEGIRSQATNSNPAEYEELQRLLENANQNGSHLGAS